MVSIQEMLLAIRRTFRGWRFVQMQIEPFKHRMHSMDARKSASRADRRRMRLTPRVLVSIPPNFIADTKVQQSEHAGVNSSTGMQAVRAQVSADETLTMPG